MPHASGGGSHGGGSHSGGSFHSSSHFGGSHGGASIPHISSRPYKGATRYVWYEGGVCRSLYQKGTPAKPNLTGTIAIAAMYSLFLVPMLVFSLVMGLFIPRAVNTASYNANIVLEDTVGLTEGSSLEAALTAFRDKTGVAPGVEIVKESVWQGHYESLNTFAYSEYLRLFDDEKHWLLVLSWPDDAEEGVEFIDWSWEGMLGDDCSSAINSASEDAFTKLVQKHLLRATSATLGDSLAAAYTEFTETGMKLQVNSFALLMAGVCALLYAGLMYKTVRSYQKQKRVADATPVTETAREYNCEYCGSLYVAGTVTKCPGCGAPIPARTEETQDAQKEG